MAFISCLLESVNQLPESTFHLVFIEDIYAFNFIKKNYC